MPSMDESVAKIAKSMNLISIMLVVLVAIVTIHTIYNVKDTMFDFPTPLPTYPTAAQQESNDTRTRTSAFARLIPAV